MLEAGIAYGDGGPARDADEAVELADRLALYPVTLKAVDARLVHKSDVGGVRVGLADAGALRAAALEMSERLSPELLFVERTADVRDGIELVIGATRDPRFGAVVLVGLGGILVETLRDTALALAPLDVAAAELLLRSLRAAAVLDGVRGRPAVDVAAAAARRGRARRRHGGASRDRRARGQPPARHAARRARARRARRAESQAHRMRSPWTCA